MPEEDQYPLEDTTYFTYLKIRKGRRVENRANRAYEHPIRIGDIGIEVEHTETAVDTRVTDLDGLPNNTNFAVVLSGSFTTTFDLTRVFSDKAPRDHEGGSSSSTDFQFSHIPSRPWELFGPDRVFTASGVGARVRQTYRRTYIPFPVDAWGPWVLDDDSSGPYNITCYLQFGSGESGGPPIGSDPDYHTEIDVSVTWDSLFYAGGGTFYRKPWEASWTSEVLSQTDADPFTTATTDVTVTFT